MASQLANWRSYGCAFGSGSYATDKAYAICGVYYSLHLGGNLFQIKRGYAGAVGRDLFWRFRCYWDLYHPGDGIYFLLEDTLREVLY